MTAARSDLMALANAPFAKAMDAYARAINSFPGTSKEAVAKAIEAYLAASQPDRAVALSRQFIIDLVHNEYDPKPDLGDASYKAFDDSWDDGTGRIADTILSLLSGAGTKSDGGGQ